MNLIADSINVRPAGKEDLPQILEIYNDVIMHTTAVYNYQPHTLAMRTEWFEQRRAQGFPVFVAEEKSSILGFSALGSFRPWAAYKYTVENSIYIKSGLRGKGLGKLLLAPLIDAAKAMDMHTIIAGIDATNEASIGLHKKFGFSEAGLIRHAGYKFDRWLDLLFMQLILETPAHPVEG